MDANQTSLLSNQAITSLVLVYVINWIKGSKLFPWFTFETQKLNHMLMIFLTFCASVGVHFVWDPKEHELAIQGLVWSTILMGVWHWIQQYAMTKFGYHILQGKLPNGNGADKKV